MCNGFQDTPHIEANNYKISLSAKIRYTKGMTELQPNDDRLLK